MSHSTKTPWSPPAEKPAGRLAMLSVLKHRDYRLYWFGQFSSVIGQNMSFVAQSWLVLQLTDSPAMLGLAGLANAIPTIGFTMLGGVAADRMDRKSLLRTTQLCQGLVYGLLGLLVVLQMVTIWWVFGFAFVSGTLRAFDQPSRAALVPHLVPRAELSEAVALGGTVWQFSRLVGPSLAGIIIATANAGVALLLAAFGFFAFAVLLTLMRAGGEAAEPSKHTSMAGEMLGGLDFIRKNELFYTLIGLTFFNSVFGMSYTVMLPYFARNILDVGSQGYGFLQTASAVGALAGTLIAASTAGYGKRGWQAIIGGAAFGSLIVVFSFSTVFQLSLVVMLLMGVANQTYMTTISTVLQTHLPNDLRGRVMGIHGLSFSLQPLGGTVAGAIAEQAGVPFAVAAGGACVALMAVAIAIFLPRVRRIV